jgi:hypothetical protein
MRASVATPELRNDLLLANPIALALYSDVNACQNHDQLDAVTKLLWERYCAGQLNDYEANYLQSCILRRRPITQRTKLGKFSTIRFPFSHFTPRPCRRRRTDEERAKRRERKRMLGGSSAMPDTMRHHYTEGERAVACIIAGEHKRKGFCDLSIDEIADRAGVGRTTVQNFQHEARRLGHIQVKHRPQRGAKNLPNVITIASAEWIAWIKRAPSAARGLDRVQFAKTVNASKSIDIRKKEALQERCGSDPPRHVEPARGESANVL